MMKISSFICVFPSNLKAVVTYNYDAKLVRAPNQRKLIGPHAASILYM